MSRQPLVYDPDIATADAVRVAIGGVGRMFSDLAELQAHLEHATGEDTVILGPGVPEQDAFSIADLMRVQRPELGVILVRAQVTTPLLQEALRAGIREVIHHRDRLGLQTAVQRSAELAAMIRQQATAPSPDSTNPSTRGRVVTVFSAKGGCGKTTLATNLAVSLADRGRREVVLVDLDLAFGDVAIALQLFPAHTIADAIPIAGSLDAEALRAVLTPHSAGLWALVAPVDPGTGESISAGLVGRILDLLSRQFDYVVIDTPPAFDDQVIAAFDASDVIALIATLDVPALKNLKLTLETLDLLQYPREKLRVVLNRADSKVGLTISEVEKTLRTPISSFIPSSRDVPAAINRGVPIMIDDPKHPVSLAIRQFGDREVLHPASAANGRERPAAAEVGGDRRSLIRKRRPRTT